MTTLISDLIKKYRQSINPPYRRKDAVTILVTVVILLAIPLTVFSILTSRSLEPKAAPAGPPRGVEGDLWADVIIGKRDFSEIGPNEIVPYKIAGSGGVVVDRSVGPGRLYVWDWPNNRILGIDLAECYSGASPCLADIVIGQISASDHGACNLDSGLQSYPNRAPAGAATLCTQNEWSGSLLEGPSYVNMFTDSAGNLYVPDYWNNRVLKYNSPFTTDTVADEVWGQDNFSGNACNRGPEAPLWFESFTAPTATSICFNMTRGWGGIAHGAAVEQDSVGSLWVADGGNNRVLRYPKNPSTGVIAKTADLVLGQANFTSNSAGASLNQMHSPTSLGFSSEGKLYVSDGENNRVLVFQPPFTSGMSAAGTFGSGFTGPDGIQMDPAGDGVWLNNTGYKQWGSRLELWDFDGTTLKKTIGLPETGTGGGSISFDTSNALLTSTYGGARDVYRYSRQPDGSYLQDKKFFSPPDGPNLTTNRRSGVSIQGVAVVANQLIVSDAGRILFWNNPTALTSGEPADGFVAVRDFNSLDSNIGGPLKADSDDRVYLARGNPTGILVYQAPLSIGAKPIKKITFPINVLGGGQITAAEVTGFVPTAHSEFLWISQSAGNLAFRIRNPLTNPQVDVVLGQTNLTGNQCNRGLVGEGQTGTGYLDTLCRPGFLSLDQHGNLYVSDHSLEWGGNKRLLMFLSSTFPTNNPSVVYAPTATKVFPNSSPRIHSTWEPAFDSTNRMLVGYNFYDASRFVGYYNNPTGPSTMPDGYLKDYHSMAYAATFDKFDSFYVGDLNRGRILIYKDPFNNNPSVPPDPPIPEVTTVNVKIKASSDDAFDGCSFETLGGITLGYDKRCTPAKPVTVGLRFQNLNIPKDATITNAVVSFISSNNYSDNLNLTVKGVAADNAATFSASNNPGTVPTTSAGASFGVDYPWQWRAVDWTPTLTSIVQEIVNRPLWQAGNSLAVVIADNGTPSTSHRGVDSYDINPDSAAELWVQYTAGGGPQPKPGDLNGDNQVDIYDLSILLSNWGASGGVADINKDGTVNIFDLSALISKWGS